MAAKLKRKSCTGDACIARYRRCLEKPTILKGVKPLKIGSLWVEVFSVDWQGACITESDWSFDWPSQRDSKERPSSELDGRARSGRAHRARQSRSRDRLIARTRSPECTGFLWLQS